MERFAVAILAASEGRSGPVLKVITNSSFVFLGLVGFLAAQLVVAAVLVGIGTACPWLGRLAESTLIFRP
jgi:hypothetical protein